MPQTIPRKPTKLDQLVSALKWKSGRSVDELAKRFGWKVHSIRAAMTRLRQSGYEIKKLQPKERGNPARYRIEVVEGK